MGEKTVHTIEDLARLAGVSKSTVSRALNDSPLISEETKARIRALAQVHDFQISAPARCLSSGHSNTIGYVTHAYYKDFSWVDLFSLEIMGGISSGLAVLGYDMLVVHVNPRDVDWAHNYLDSGRVDGFVVMTGTYKSTHIKALAEMKAPFVAWGVQLPDLSYCSVTGDNFNGGKLATRRLLEIGRRKIGFLGGRTGEAEVQLRFKGYEAALQEAGVSVNPALVTYGDYSHASGTGAMKYLLQQTPDLDAVFVNSDVMAIAAMDTVREHGRRVPEDVAVVGYDDLSIAAHCNPPLTTIRQNVPMLGRVLAQNLVQYLRTGMISNAIMPVELVVRKSA